MRRVLLGMVVGMVVVGTASARLGETLAQLEQRFGKGSRLSDHYIKPPVTNVYRFSRNDISVTAYFIGSRCGRITYASRGRGFSDAEIDQLLDANGRLWLDAEPERADGRSDLSAPEQCWITQDRRIHAERYYHSLTFFTREYIAAEVSARKARIRASERRDNSRLEGF